MVESELMLAKKMTVLLFVSSMNSLASRWTYFAFLRASSASLSPNNFPSGFPAASIPYMLGDLFSAKSLETLSILMH